MGETVKDVLDNAITRCRTYTNLSKNVSVYREIAAIRLGHVPDSGHSTFCQLTDEFNRPTSIEIENFIMDSAPYWTYRVFDYTPKFNDDSEWFMDIDIAGSDIDTSHSSDTRNSAYWDKVGLGRTATSNDLSKKNNNPQRSSSSDGQNNKSEIFIGGDSSNTLDSWTNHQVHSTIPYPTQLSTSEDLSQDKLMNVIDLDKPLVQYPDSEQNVRLLDTEMSTRDDLVEEMKDTLQADRETDTRSTLFDESTLAEMARGLSTVRSEEVSEKVLNAGNDLSEHEYSFAQSSVMKSEKPKEASRHRKGPRSKRVPVEISVTAEQ